MTLGLRREFANLALLIIISLLLGQITGYTAFTLILGLLGYIGWQLRQLNRLIKWLGKPGKKVPDTVGGWDEVYYRLHQVYKRQQKSRKRLAMFLKRFQKSAQALPYATIILDNSFRIEWFNPVAGELFNLRSKTDIGQKIDNLVRLPEFFDFINQAKFKNALEINWQNRKVICKVTPFGNDQYLLNARDITLNSQINEMRRDFISNASHELRTPITVMSGYLEVLLDRDLEASVTAPLEKIQAQTQRMERIIAELIELAKLESAPEINRQVLDVKILLQDVYNEAKGLDQGRHNISVDVQDVPLVGSYEELRMALSNLVTNAIRYTPEGRSIEIFSHHDHRGSFVGVKDEGPGISYQHIPRLTERFYRVDSGRCRDVGGTGLGLSIVKNVLDRHEASLQIESVLDQGSTFSCYFPAASTENVLQASNG